jgi:type IV pilus assembly protein PilV
MACHIGGRVLTAPHCRGSSLLEVLVAMLLLSFGLLSLAAWHGRALQHGRSSQYRAVASQLALDLADRMRANLPGVAAGAYTRMRPYEVTDAPEPEPPCADAVACSGTEMAARDLAQWLNAARTTLPGAGLMARRDLAQDRVVDIWVLWQPASADLDTGQTSLRRRCPPEVGDAPPGLQCLLMRVSP